MAQCLICQRNAIPTSHVMCRSCFQEHEKIIREVQAEPLPPFELRKKLWGQQYERNRTPANRARIAYAAHLLAAAGDDELLGEVRRLFSSPAEPASTQAAAKATPPVTVSVKVAERPPVDALGREALEVTHLEEALGERDRTRTQVPGTFRTKDGHWVRSKSEREIANFLFDNRIAYQYERRVTISDVDLFPDFYLPDAGEGLYLEHFGLLDNPRYRHLADRKVALFQRAGLPLVATDEHDALDWDSALQRKLSRHFPELNRR